MRAPTTPRGDCDVSVTNRAGDSHHRLWKTLGTKGGHPVDDRRAPGDDGVDDAERAPAPDRAPAPQEPPTRLSPASSPAGRRRPQVVPSFSPTSSPGSSPDDPW